MPAAGLTFWLRGRIWGFGALWHPSRVLPIMAWAVPGPLSQGLFLQIICLCLAQVSFLWLYPCFSPLQISQTVIEVSGREGMVLCAKGRGPSEGRLKAALCHAQALTRWRAFDPFLLHLQIPRAGLFLERLVWGGKAAGAAALWGAGPQTGFLLTERLCGGWSWLWGEQRPPL